MDEVKLAEIRIPVTDWDSKKRIDGRPPMEMFTIGELVRRDAARVHGGKITKAIMDAAIKERGGEPPAAKAKRAEHFAALEEIGYDPVAIAREAGLSVTKWDYVNAGGLTEYAWSKLRSSRIVVDERNVAMNGHIVRYYYDLVQYVEWFAGLKEGKGSDD